MSNRKFSSQEEEEEDCYFRELLLAPLRVCLSYTPKIGGESDGVSLAQFKEMFGRDPLYHWLGFDHDLMYTAHKAAGGITSIYRQLGIGIERLMRAVIHKGLGLTDEELQWGYEIVKENGATGSLTLDARIDVSHIRNSAAQRKFQNWILKAGQKVKTSPEITGSLKGAVFEIRQGYKSVDSKRQNADLRSALRAYTEHYLPVMMIVSTQISSVVLRRYESDKLLVLIGSTEGNATESTFAFMRDVVDYDLGAFFERNSKTICLDMDKILEKLLSP